MNQRSVILLLADKLRVVWLQTGQRLLKIVVKVSKILDYTLVLDHSLDLRVDGNHLLNRRNARLADTQRLLLRLGQIATQLVDLLVLLARSSNLGFGHLFARVSTATVALSLVLVLAVGFDPQAVSVSAVSRIRIVTLIVVFFIFLSPVSSWTVHLPSLTARHSSLLHLL